MALPPQVLDRFRQRLRTPAPRCAVPGSLPVLYFGDIEAAANGGIATIGINPSDQEYVGPDGRELMGPARRLETLRSLGVEGRARRRQRESLSDQQCDRAMETMRTYFHDGRPVYSWFRALARVVDGWGGEGESGGASFSAGTAVHLNLVLEATAPRWSQLLAQHPRAARDLLDRDLQFLRFQLESLPFRAILCTSRLVLSRVTSFLDAQVVESGRLARLTWTIARASVNGRDLTIAAWNIPLVRPTGLTAAGHAALGALLRAKTQSRARAERPRFRPRTDEDAPSVVSAVTAAPGPRSTVT
jgi:hypothetical protein